jgi:hypothetical protein
MANSNLQTTTPAPSPTRAVNLLTLPAEILINIGQNLCLHCRVPCIGEIPDDDAATGIREQTALANLSACSRLLRSVAQPILFHFFHSLAGVVFTLLRLTQFVHTIYHRPDLAASVRSLVLWTPHHELEEWRGDAPHRLFENNKHGKDGKSHDLTACVRAAMVERLGHEPWQPVLLGTSLEEMQELALSLTSGTVGYLLLQRSYYRTRGADWQDWAHPMERLRHVVLVGWRYRWPRTRFTYHIKHLRAFLSCARDLESLVAVDCGAGTSAPFVVSDQDELKALLWDVELPRLRRLSISGENIGVEEVEAIVRHSTVFEELELFHTQYLRADWERDVLDLEMHLGTAKKTLKRLCYSAFQIKAMLKETDVYIGEGSGVGNPDDDEDYFDPTWHRLGSFEVGFSLKDFSVLETLELEQLLLYGPVFENPYNVENDRSCELVTTYEFLEKFPPSLMRLRIGCIFYWPIVFRDMLAMAEECGRFPKLGSVALEVRMIPPKEEFDYLVEAFRRSGIALSIRSVVRDPFSRGLLPTRPGFPVRLPQPVSYSRVR